MATVLPPQKRETSRARAAPGRSTSRTWCFRGGRRSAATRRPCGVHYNPSHEDRARRSPQERQDDTVQPPHRLQRGDVALRRRPRRAAHRRGARARSARRSAERTVQAQEDDVRHVRGGRPRRDREGRARRRSTPRSSATPTPCCTWCARSPTTHAGRPTRGATSWTSSWSWSSPISRSSSGGSSAWRRRSRSSARTPRSRSTRVLVRLKTSLEAETPLRAVTLTPDEIRLLRGFTFLSQKPILHLVNVEESGIAEAEKIAERYGLGRRRRPPADAGGLGVGGDRSRDRPARAATSSRRSWPISD